MSPQLITTPILSILSGLLIGLACQYNLPVIGCIALVPLMYTVLEKSSHWKSALLQGSLTGTALGAWITVWLIDGLSVFVEGSTWVGWLGFIVATLIIAIHYALISTTIFIFKKMTQNIIMLGLAVSSVFTIFESFYHWVFKSFPLFQPFVSFTQFDNLWLLQHAEWGGYKIITFLLILINYCVYVIWRHFKKIKITGYALVTIVLIHLSGWLILKNFESKAQISEWSARIVTINPNFKTTDTWNEKTGHTLMSKIIRLAQNAVVHKPDVVLWTEGLVPWSYQKDDDFIQELKKINQNQDIIHIVGMETVENHNRYNSVYAFDFNNDRHQRYDKSRLIAFAEQQKKFIGIDLSFSRSSKYSQGDQNQKSFDIKGAKVSTVICNENLIPERVTELLNDGHKELLIVIANNSWISPSYISVHSHFYNSVFRAIENRTNIIMNSNQGLHGYIQSSGEFHHSPQGIYDIDHQKSLKGKTLYSQFPYVANVFMITLIFIIIFSYIYKK